MQEPNLENVSDDKLLRDLSDILKTSRWAEADLVARIAEVDARRLYAREAASSMFAYCTEILHLSEQEAYLRIAVGRASREHPVLLVMLRDGRLHLSGIARLAPHLTRENRDAVLARATHMSHRKIVELVAELAPRPSAPAMMRKLPARKARELPASVGPLGGDKAGPPLELCAHRVGGPADHTQLASEPGAPEGAGPHGQTQLDSGLCAHRVGSGTGGCQPAGVEASSPCSRAVPVRTPRPLAVVEPVAPARFRVRFDASAEFREKLERLQALTRSRVPDGDLAKVIELAVTRELERLEARRFAKTKAPRRSLSETDTKPKTRHIPAAVRRAVEKRDGGRCAYRDTKGRRCTKRHDLDFHHRKPFGLGGEHSPGNVALMCKAHNALLAEADYGKEVMARSRAPATQARQERVPLSA